MTAIDTTPTPLSALSSSHERTAALLGYAEPAFAAWLMQTRSDPATARAERAAIGLATQINVEGRAFFRTDVLDAGKKAQRFASIAGAFALELRRNLSVLAREKWATLPDDVTTAMLVAARAHFGTDVQLATGRTAKHGIGRSQIGEKIEWTVPKRIQRRKVGQIIGPDTAGKSTVVTALMCAAATPGQPRPKVLDVEIPFGASIAFTTEDADGYHERINAYADVYSIDAAVLYRNVHVVDLVTPLLDETESMEFVLRCVDDLDPDAAPLAFIVVDHYRDAIDDGDNNDGSIAQRAFRTAQSIGAVTGASVIILDHTGHDEARAAAAGAKVKRDKSHYSLNITKRGTGNDRTATWNKIKNVAPTDRPPVIFHIDGSVPVVVAGSGGSVTSASFDTRAAALYYAIDDMATATGNEYADLPAVELALAQSFPDIHGVKATIARTTYSRRAKAVAKHGVSKGWLVAKGKSWKIGAEPPEPGEEFGITAEEAARCTLGDERPTYIPTAANVATAEQNALRRINDRRLAEHKGEWGFVGEVSTADRQRYIDLLANVQS